MKNFKPVRMLLLIVFILLSGHVPGNPVYAKERLKLVENRECTLK